MISQELLYTLFYSIAFLVILVTGEILHIRYSIKAEHTRKLAHSSASLLSLSFPMVYDGYGYVLVMGVLFFLILLIAQRRKLLQSINDVSRHTYGGILLPVAICGAFIISVWQNDTKLFIIPILIMGISDSLAGLAGMSLGLKMKRITLFRKEFNKTYLGSGVFLISTFAISVVVLHQYLGNYSLATILTATALAVGTAVAEALSSKGLDNLSVPLAAILILMIS